MLAFAMDDEQPPEAPEAPEIDRRQFKTGDLIEEARQLIFSPGEWKRVRVYESATSASNVASRIRTRTKNWPRGRWQVVGRVWKDKSVLYIKYLGVSENGAAEFEDPGKPGRHKGTKYTPKRNRNEGRHADAKWDAPIEDEE